MINDLLGKMYFFKTLDFSSLGLKISILNCDCAETSC